MAAQAPTRARIEEYAEHLARTWGRRVVAEGHTLDDFDAMLRRILELDAQASCEWFAEQLEKSRRARARRAGGVEVDEHIHPDEAAAERLLMAIIRDVYEAARGDSPLSASSFPLSSKTAPP